MVAPVMKGESVNKKKLAMAALVASLAVGTLAAQPAKASTSLAIGSVLDIDKLDPHTATNFATVRALGLVYSSLIEVGPANKLKTGLATAWRFSADGKTLRLTLREGVKFHDGSTFDAVDAKASLERILDPKTASAARANINTITSITASGRFLTLNMSVSNIPILSALDGVNMAMLSSADIAAGKVGGTNKPNGTGAYKFESWEPTQSVKLSANPTYWMGEPKISDITIRVIPNEASILSAMNAGTIQFGIISDPLIARQVNTRKLKLFKTPALAYYALQLNNKVAPFNDKNVRLAVQCALDRQEVVNTAMLGQGAITGPITSPAFRSSTTARPCPKADLAKAKAYLTASGKTDVTFKALVTSTGWATSVAMAQNIKAQLAKAGITMELDITDQATYVPRWLAGDFVATLANNGGRIDPDTMYTRYFTSTGNLNKVATYASSTLDANFLKGKSSAKSSVRTEAYTAISKELEDNAVWVWIAAPFEYRVADKKLKNFTALTTGSLLPLRSASLG
jgi:peptide/nickel transport system substrate-binding protein